jgi:hypothetical protein
MAEYRPTEHIGFAGRRAAQFRFGDDRQEYEVQFSHRLARDLLFLLDAAATPLSGSGDVPVPGTLLELRAVLASMQDDDEDDPIVRAGCVTL